MDFPEKNPPIPFEEECFILFPRISTKDYIPVSSREGGKTAESLPGRARPGSKGGKRKNHEAPSRPRTARANGSGIPVSVFPPGRGDRRSPDRPASFCGSGSGLPGKGLARPMLFAPPALASRPQSWACRGGKRPKGRGASFPLSLTPSPPFSYTGPIG